MRTLVLGLLLFLSPRLLIAQSSNSANVATDASKLPNVMSVEAATLGKHGSYEVNYNTGSPNISVPLYSLKTSAIPVNISLNYDSKGLVPNESGYDVGKNWNLSAGGAITRVVVGVPDERYDPNYTPNLSEQQGMNMQCESRGMIYGIRNYQTYSSTHLNDLNNFVASNNSLGIQGSLPNAPFAQTRIWYNLNYETQPDMFTFNFLGYSGRFFMGNDGLVKVISDKKFKVDLVEFGLNQYDFTTQVINLNNAGAYNSTIISRIKLTADDGTEFWFGGALKDLEFSIVPADGRKTVFNAWNLTKVLTVSGETIDFINEPFIEGTNNRKDVTRLKIMLQGLHQNQGEEISPLYEERINISQRRTSKRCFGSMSGTGMEENQMPLPQSSKTMIKKCYLKKIQTDLEEITLNYVTNPKFYLDSDFPQGITSIANTNAKCFSQRLQSISIKDRKMAGVNILNMPVINEDLELNSNYSKQITFNYTKYRNYYFLASINQGRGKVTEFKYENLEYAPGQTNLPSRLTLGIDYMGFYNNNGLANSGFGIFDSNHDLVDNPYRQPNELTSKIGILKEIIHPTKGKTVFEFEAHKIGTQLKRTNLSPVQPVLFSFTGSGLVVPGLRIKKIQNIPGESVEYKYVKNWETQSDMQSSGIINYTNVSGFSFMETDIWGNLNQLLVENNLAQSSTYSEPVVSYSEVVKIYSEGFEKFKFSTHLTNPDNLNTLSSMDASTIEFSSSNSVNQLKKALYIKSSTEIERGKLLGTYIYNNSSQLIKKKEFTYNQNPSRFSFSAPAVNRPGFDFLCQGNNLTKLIGFVNVYNNYFYQYPVIKEEETTYNYIGGNNTSFVNTKEYEYINPLNPLLRKIKTKNSKSYVQEETILYAEDLISVPNSVYATMAQKNMTGIPVKTISTINSGSVLKTNILNFSLFNQIPYFSKQETINELIAPNQTIQGVEITKYTTQGQIAESKESSGTITAYKWDYNGKFLVAKITNSLEADVKYSSFENFTNTQNIASGFNYSNAGIVNDMLSATGRSHYNLNFGLISAEGLNQSKKYILSFWRKANSQVTISGGQYTLTQTQTGVNGWIYIQAELNNATTLQLSGNGVIDELRLYPEKAFIETYTYEALVGLKNKCDANNKISYYEYDDNFRLVLIRDQDNNVLKKICYNYAGQVEDCTLCTNFTPNWQNTTTPLRCQLNAQGNNTGYQEQEQRDMNICNQVGGIAPTRWVQLAQNTTTCPVPTLINLTSTMPYPLAGYTATYTLTGNPSISYNFNVIGQAGLQPLGAIPVGDYTLLIQRTNASNAPITLFKNGCRKSSQTGTVSATFYNVPVNAIDCNSITIDLTVD
jgi:YD repeat-containing protein